MPELITVLTEKEIDRLINSMAQKISEDYKDKRLVLIGVLKGAFIFLGDLVRQITIPVEIDFIQFSSYGNNDSSSGDVQLRSDISSEIKDKDVRVVDCKAHYVCHSVDGGFLVGYGLDYAEKYRNLPALYHLNL